MAALLRRLLLAPIPRLIWTVLLAMGLGWLLRRIAPDLAAADNVTVQGSVRSAVMTLLVFTLGLRLFERKWPADAGLSPARAIPDLTRGFALGATLLSTMVAVLAVVGCYHLLGWAVLPPGIGRATLLGRLALLFLAAAVFEEVAARGILFRVFIVMAHRRGQIVTPGWMRWIAARLRGSSAAPVAPVAPPGSAPAAADGTPS